MQSFEGLGIRPPEVLLPKGCNWQKWAVIACDQYTSQPEYWQKVADFVGDDPSTLHIILPEIYLENENKQETIARINKNMDVYLNDVLEPCGEGFVFVRRQIGKGVLNGLVCMVDLEDYEYTKGSENLIRATEDTILERIPPRVEIRKDAKMESPHIILLFEDKDDILFKKLNAEKDEMQKLYDFDLMQDSGHIEGRLVPKDLEGYIVETFANIKEKAGDPPFLFAVGDGNHSLATAKACYEQLKKDDGEDIAKGSPARYALVELVNIYDKALVFRPIHRVLFGVGAIDCSAALTKIIREQGGEDVSCAWYQSLRQAEDQIKKIPAGSHIFRMYTQDFIGVLCVGKPSSTIEAATLQNALDVYLEGTGVNIDYIHGDNAAQELGSMEGNLSFLLPTMDKASLFEAVRRDGRLVRKTFSMGEADDKRFYLECRKIK